MGESDHPELVEEGLEAIGEAYGEDAAATVRRVLAAGLDGWAWDALGRRPDSRPIKDLVATDRCDRCGLSPAPLVLTGDGTAECYNCGEPNGGA